MNTLSNIKFYGGKEINKEKWDEQFAVCTNRLIYGESVFLDHVCPGWSALISEDWQSMMPLPIKSKMSIHYAFQPPFIQQLGIFYSDQYTVDVNPFLERAVVQAPLIDLNFNYANDLPIGEKCCNYILDLSIPFDDLKKSFRKDLISKAKANKLICEETDIDNTIDAYIKEVVPRTKGLSLHSIQNFRKLCQHYESHDRLFCRKVVSQHNEPLGYALFLKDDRRIYYMLSATEKKGKSVDANPFLLHEVIREFSGKQLIFDFEGSEIPGVKFFFEKFAPQAQPYTRVRMNRLNSIQKVLSSVREFIRK